MILNQTTAQRPLSAFLDVLVLLLLAGLGTLLTLLLPQQLQSVRLLVNSVSLLVVPGYLVMLILFPRQKDLALTERVVLSLGLSVVVVVLLSLGVHSLATGFQTEAVSVGLLGVIALAAALAVWRRASLPKAERFLSWKAFPVRPVLLIGILLAVGLPLVQQFFLRANYTEFYVLGRQGRLENYPRTLSPSQAFTLRVGVGNRELRAQSYTIRVAGKPAAVFTTPLIAKGETYETQLSLQAPTQAGSQRLRLELYRAGEAARYRYLELGLDVTPLDVTPKETSNPLDQRP